MESTHFIFDGEKVVISPNLYSVVSFLQEIEKEIESFLNFDISVFLGGMADSRFDILSPNQEFLKSKELNWLVI